MHLTLFVQDETDFIDRVDVHIRHIEDGNPQPFGNCLVLKQARWGGVPNVLVFVADAVNPVPYLLRRELREGGVDCRSDASLVSLTLRLPGKGLANRFAISE